MDYGPVYFWTIFIYFCLYVLWEVINDPQTWEPADISRPELGPETADPAFYWSMMMNQRGDE